MTSSHETPAEASLASEARAHLRRTWQALPTAAVSGCLSLAVVVGALLIAPGLSPVTVLLLAFGLAPVLAATVGVFLERDPASGADLGAFLHLLRRLLRPSLAVAGPPAAALALAVLALEVHRQTHWAGWLVSLAAAGAAAVVTTMAAVPALVLRAREPGTAAREIWGRSMRATARHPLAAVAVVIVALAATWLLGTSTTLAVVLVPAPVCACIAFAGRTVYARA